MSKRKAKPQPCKYPLSVRDKAPVLRAQGMSYRQIGEALGAPLQTVRLWCKGVRKPKIVGSAFLLPWQIADIQQNTRLRDPAYSIQAQAREYGVSPTTIARIVRAGL